MLNSDFVQSAEKDGSLFHPFFILKFPKNIIISNNSFSGFLPKNFENRIESMKIDDNRL
jgi:hypothetical protein